MKDNELIYLLEKPIMSSVFVSLFRNRRILIIVSTKTLESVTVAARHLRLQKYEEKRESNRELLLVLSKLSPACFTFETYKAKHLTAAASAAAGLMLQTCQYLGVR